MSRKSQSLQEPYLLGMLESNPEPAPEKADVCSHPLAAGSKSQQFYKSLLNEYAQKLRKPHPMYQTRNEGFDHLPKFRATVWFDGIRYTSSNTFQQRKMAEMDVSRVAYLSVIKKSKNEALQVIQEDKTFCKFILVEYAVKMNLGKPEYQTIQLQSKVPAFSSSVVFNGVMYTGGRSKSKKEAQQLVARDVVMKYIDSESGNDMVEIINRKSRQFSKMNEIQEIKNVDNETIVVGAQWVVNNYIAINGNTSQALEHMPVTCQTSVKNRTKKNKKKEKKKLLVDAQDANRCCCAFKSSSAMSSSISVYFL